MKAIFIDAENQQVSVITTKGLLEDKYLIMKVNMVEIGRYWDNGDTLWVDEEGLINGTKYGFQLDNKYFMGNALILGTNRENPELCDSAVTPLEDIKVKFLISIPA